LELFPAWVESFAAYNPMAIAIEGMRETLLGDAGWSRVATDVLKLLPISFASLLLGIFAFRMALRRERQAGTLGHY
jgi:ABC-type polysaccharide/polyol phosphate export permease